MSQKNTIHALPRHIYAHVFNTIPSIGPVRLKRLQNFFPSLEEAWGARPADLLQAGLPEKCIEEIIDTRTRTTPEQEYNKLKKLGITLLGFDDPTYPALLKEIPDPPPILYMKGSLEALDRFTIAVVGSRSHTAYGARVTQDLVRELVEAGCVIVSGLALGIDGIAHNTTLQYNGDTIGVLASGLDAIYPANNRQLAEKIENGHGALISEFAPGTPPLKHHFPIRNRIIAGLSQATLVVEAASSSGALITAQHALEQNREVFAVPGTIYNDRAAGTLALIKQGAVPVTSAADIFEAFHIDIEKPMRLTSGKGHNEYEQKILDLLSREPMHLDVITKKTGFPPHVIVATMTIMELKGKIKNTGANQYVKM